MCCCAMEFELSRRQWIWTTVLAAASTWVATKVGAQEGPSPAALKLLLENPSVDIHTHGGTTGITSKSEPSDALANAMRGGHLGAVCFAEVPDGPLLGRDALGVLRALRVPPAGELYAWHKTRMDWVDALVAKFGMRRALTADDVRAAHATHAPILIQDIEGLDFLEGKLERLSECHQRGVRKVQLVHYTPNDIGDFQTGQVVHNGLTPFGADVIREANRLRFVVDVAHATEDTVMKAVKVASRPLILSHTAIQGSVAQGQTPLTGRQITPAHAKTIAATGGAIGLWHFFPSFKKYAEGVREMVDVVGMDHVCIGTDASSGVGLLPDSSGFAKLADALLDSGFSSADTAKIVGGNFLRVFAASTAA
jgi:membrane dipeptidase